MFDYDLRTDPTALDAITTEAIEKYINKHLPSFHVHTETEKGKIWVGDEPQVIAIAKPEISDYALGVMRVIEDIAKLKQCTKREVVDELLEKKIES